LLALLHAIACPGTPAAPLRRFCLARCPHFGLGVGYNTEAPGLELIVVYNAWLQGVRIGEPLGDDPAGEAFRAASSLAAWSG